MKITIVQGAFFPVPPLRGGAVEKVWFALGQEFVRRGHQVTHVSRSFENLPREEIIGGVRHLRVDGFDAPASLGLLKFFDFIYSWRTLNFLPEADILVTNTFWLPILARKKSRGRLYIHVARTPRGQLRFYSHAARLQTVSESTLEAMQQEAPRLAQKFKCIPYPLLKRSTDFTQPEIREREKRLLYVGRIHPEKGIGLLLQALAKISPSLLSDWKLHIVGSADAKDGGGGSAFLASLQKMTQGLAAQVVWTGPIFDSQLLAEQYRQAALFIYPSLAEKGETFGLAPLEAMSESCPALVSDLACFSGFIENGKTGFVFDHRTAEPATNLARQLSELISQPDLLKTIGKQAYEKARSFSVDQIGEAYLADFASLIETSPLAVSSPLVGGKKVLTTFPVEAADESPWPLRERILRLFWDYSWLLFCQWTPESFNPWRLFWLRLFGAHIEGTPFVHRRARIQIPWNLTLRHRSYLGDRANAYSLGEIEIGERAMIAPEAYLCTGTHDMTLPSLPLQVGKITIGDDAFIGPRAIILPGIQVGKSAVVEACSVVTRDVAESRIVSGNPARETGTRTLSAQNPV